MKIELHEIPVRDVVAGYVDSAENGVVGYGGKLNIRPAFQREFIYKDKQRDEVIHTITKQFPLNVMYWVKGDRGSFELLDGQQRTISICQYVNGDFSIDHEYLLDGNEKHLSIRAFSPKMARTAYERQKGICPKCGKHFAIEEMQADHITPWSKGGKTVPENCQMLCADCNRRKSNI